MRILLHILLIGCFLLIRFDIYANHIVGGEVTYTCLGNNEYEVIIKVYRDCASSGSILNGVISLGIYTENNGNYESYDIVSIALDGGQDSIINIPPPEIPCVIIPDNICVEEGSYRKIITLPPSNKSYYLSYQRCCRNSTINNIYNPDDIGVSFMVEISPEAQQVCNDSPVFKDFPPTVICLNQPIKFDHSAIDIDGDQLVYEFCSPLIGGGIGTIDQCLTSIPVPPCPPPYDPVPFILPTYTAIAPMGGNPTVTINPLTGLITGIPDIAGQFVVGVCVKEYRAGVLIGSIQRDFQFNVLDCAPAVAAAIEAPLEMDGTYVYNTCGEGAITIGNESTYETSLNNFFWEFDIDGQTKIYEDWNVNLSLPDTGVYHGQFILNSNELCSDTANIKVNVFPLVHADFDIDYDSCTAEAVVINDASFSDSESINRWHWDFGNGTIAEEQNAAILYDDLGTYPITLIVGDENNCFDTLVQSIDWFPEPPLILVEPNTFVGCPPANIQFDNLTTPIDESYQVTWDFGDGITTESINAVHQYEEVGTYTINVEITSPFGCITKRTYENWITITPEPIADFIYSPEEINSLNPTVEFQDISQYTESWFWNFNDESIAYTQNPSYVFKDTGYHQIQLIAINSNGCSDTLLQVVDVVPKVTYFLPNAFTPNGDGENDLFLGVGYFEGLYDFRMEIWNRWGELIYFADDPTKGWNGSKNNLGNLSPAGVYIVSIHYKEPRGQAINKKGKLTLLR